jgi:hypothetical protein
MLGVVDSLLLHKLRECRVESQQRISGIIVGTAHLTYAKPALKARVSRMLHPVGF